MKAKSFEELYKKAKERESYLAASLILEFTEGLHELMESNKITRKDLAKRLGTSPAYVTKILRGNINFTVESMVRLAKAVGGTVQIHIGYEEIRWFGIALRRKEEVPVPEWSDYVQKDEKRYSNKETDNGPITLAA